MISELGILQASVATAINGGTWGESFTAQAKYYPVLDLDDLVAMQVSVLGRGIEREVSTRSSVSAVYGIDVVIEQSVSQDGRDARLDVLIGFVSDMMDFLSIKNLGEYHWLSCVSDPVFSLERLYDQSVFSSVINLSYRQEKQIF